MCGRIVQYTDRDDAGDYQLRFRITLLEEDFSQHYRSNYNGSPTQRFAIVTSRNGERSLETMQWGLVPVWAKDPAIGNKMINARAETLAEKASFKNALKKRRCIVPVRGFYEWKAGEGRAKTPMYIHLPDDGLLGMAGLYEFWKKPDGEWLATFTIITTEPNELMATIHNRMPVILTRETEDLWLAEGELAPPELAQAIQPYPGLLEAYPVSTLVNSPRNNDPSLLGRAG